MQKGEKHPNEPHSLGRAIRESRNDMKLSQKAFAERCGLDRAFIGRIERGEVSASLDSIGRIARALKLKPSWLLDRADL